MKRAAVLITMILVWMSLLFSCEQRTERNVVVMDTVTVDVDPDAEPQVQEREGDWRETDAYIREQLDSLRDRAQQEGGDIEMELRESANQLERERQNLVDTTLTDVEREWENFRVRVDNTIDSLQGEYERRRREIKEGGA